MGCMLAQEDALHVERAVYYISKKLMMYELNYSWIEKTCLALVWATRKLRHYMQAYQVHVVSRMDPLKYLYEKLVLVGRVTKWVVMLSKFDLTYISKKTMKGRVMAEFLADFPVEGEEEGEVTFPNEDIVEIHAENPWRLYFDGATNQKGYGIRIVLVAPDKSCMPLSIRLNFEATNNMAEYEACVMGLEALITLKAREVDVFGDSLLVISQAQRIWKTKD